MSAHQYQHFDKRSPDGGTRPFTQSQGKGPGSLGPITPPCRKNGTVATPQPLSLGLSSYFVIYQLDHIHQPGPVSTPSPHISLQPLPAALRGVAGKAAIVELSKYPRIRGPARYFNECLLLWIYRIWGGHSTPNPLPSSGQPGPYKTPRLDLVLTAGSQGELPQDACNCNINATSLEDPSTCSYYEISEQLYPESAHILKSNAL